MRRKILSIVAERWRAYKTTLTSKYVFGKKRGEFPGNENLTIDQETWDAFIESRMSEEFMKKQKKAQETQAKNETSVITSRGGYQLLKKKIMKEKDMKQQTSQDDIAVSDPPSPPMRQELWKFARIKKMGEFITEAAKEILLAR
uniref:Uncharacterized protein n=1 Tax=Cajanus cajan TaxID=3821 RepID=A0A151UAK2_CAJCA|nr:hypothetical protein KK1_020501 [Cajanus cajan]